MYSVLEMYDWSFIDTLAVDDSSLQFTETILEAARQAIPQREIVESKRSHPWINDAALALIESKRKAEGTPGEAQAKLACSIGLAAERQRYVANLNGTLRTLPRGSKLWWIKSRELMRMQGKHQGIPALRTDDGNWKCLAETKPICWLLVLRQNVFLPPEEANCYTEPREDSPLVQADVPLLTIG